MNKRLKIVFWLFVGVNVIFFSVMKSGIFDAGQALPEQRALHAEKIILLTASEGAAGLAQSGVVAVSSVDTGNAAEPRVVDAVASSCYEWGEFTGVELDRAKQALSALQLGGKLSQREIEHVIGFWVYIAPQKDKAAVAQKVAQLKARGVTEYFIVQEAGEWLNAISLGMFKTREAAQKFLEGLNEQDVRTAKIGERASKIKATEFVINDLDAEKSSKLAVLQKEFQGAELKIVSCH